MQKKKVYAETQCNTESAGDYRNGVWDMLPALAGMVQYVYYRCLHQRALTWQTLSAVSYAKIFSGNHHVNWHTWSPNNKILAQVQVFTVKDANLTCSYLSFHRSVSILFTETSYCGGLIWISTWRRELQHIFSAGQLINRYSRLFSESIISKQGYSHCVLRIWRCIIFIFVKTYLRNNHLTLKVLKFETSSWEE